MGGNIGSSGGMGGGCCCSVDGCDELGGVVGGVCSGVSYSIVYDCGDVGGAGCVALGFGVVGVGGVDGVGGGVAGVARLVGGVAASALSMELLTMADMSRVGGDATAAVTMSCLSPT
jgi:hypothetical protein